MDDTQPTIAHFEQAGEQLFHFAIARSDMQAILEALPVESPTRRVTLEYEIQMLRIVTVGWAIAFFLAENGLGERLGGLYWGHVQSFSSTLSDSASLSAPTRIDYFDLLKQRLDGYVAALNGVEGGADPAMAIGPAFAQACGDRRDACACLAGSKMFAHTICAVREFLDDAFGRRGLSS